MYPDLDGTNITKPDSVSFRKFEQIIKFCYNHDIDISHIDNNGRVSSDSIIDLSEKSFKKLPIKFSSCAGNFLMSHNSTLTTLQGCPDMVTDTFDISNCPNLTSLEHSPKQVYSYTCNKNYGITNLRGISQTVNGIFCFRCSNLTSLVGSPTNVELMDVTGCGLQSLEGVPKKIGAFHCGGNLPLTPYNMRFILFSEVGYILTSSDTLDKLFNDFFQLPLSVRKQEIFSVMAELKTMG